MRRLTALAALMLCLGMSSVAIAQEASSAPDAERIAAARDLMDVTGVKRQMDGMMDAMLAGFSQGAQAETSETGKQATAEFQAVMSKFMSYKEDMLKDFAVLYAETFTAAEMKEVADFYRSGTGAKFVSVTPALMQKGAQIGIKYSQKIASEMRTQPSTKPSAP